MYTLITLTIGLSHLHVIPSLSSSLSSPEVKASTRSNPSSSHTYMNPDVLLATPLLVTKLFKPYSWYHPQSQRSLSVPWVSVTSSLSVFPLAYSLYDIDNFHLKISSLIECQAKLMHTAQYCCYRPVSRNMARKRLIIIFSLVKISQYWMCDQGKDSGANCVWTCHSCLRRTSELVGELETDT